ncbi:hypothetical protein TBLA_0C01070 [Henningerozyma blattae CBS 6284]|uniref:DNA-directed RNA polymerase III subunit RPC6 n=1 Tax=Henningerozyma blattae (strain ATCC 34711 / CBS 6284 / DSM 70876 / NBRC 10599 / NRRL Y-10934 / UCD 77-7) TaxID=1071380 RepID=I2H0M0_HENB6|nr:hypothetical protein TBLA_0C01070 [Tetrapisispora blattae CBS 6284]CCH59922.1 hypothetical protein TBLA_0C01070 [Tetrapisispora blattae CBS 6284]
MNSSTTVPLSDNAKHLHEVMMSKQPNQTLFTQDELKTILGIDSLADMMHIVQELLNSNLIRLIKQNNELKFQPVDKIEASKKSTMSAEESLVYSYIEASGREGIWSKTIKARTNLHQHIVLKCLKSLESQRYVKSVKSVKFPTRKIYMLYNLQPSTDVTGGPWFTDSELDVEFINSLLTIVWRFVSERTFPNGFKNFTMKQSKNSNTFEQLYAPNVKNYANIDEILEFIMNAKVANVELSNEDIRSLCQVLVYDDRLEKIAHDCYRVTLQSVLQMTQSGVIQTSDKNNKKKDEQKEPKGIFDPNFEDFSIFTFYNTIAPTTGDKEAIYFDEWTL